MQNLPSLPLIAGLLGTLYACGDDGSDSSPGAAAQPTTFRVTVTNAGTASMFPQSGVFNIPDNAADAAPIGPQQSYSFDFFAGPGMRLSFATMFIPSNDWIYAPSGDGIALFDDQGMPRTGDVTSEVLLVDVGTEADEVLGEGANQPQRDPNGHEADPNTMVRFVNAGGNGVPTVTEVIRVELAATQEMGAYRFTATLTNVSTGTTLGGTQAVPLSPGVFVVHTDSAPLYMMGEPDRAMGLQEIAEVGDPSILGSALEGLTGVTLLGSPGVFAVSTQDGLLFSEGSADLGQGLEAIAEDGSPGPLGDALAQLGGVSGVFNTPEGAAAPGPIGPGGAYSFTVSAVPGERLFVTGMVVPTNDWLFATPANGLELFNGADPINGDFTSVLSAYDAGTEVDQPIGFGLDQVQFQAGPDTGDADADATVRNLGIAHPFELQVTPVP